MTSRRGFLASLAAVVAGRRIVPQELSMDLDAFRAQCIDPYLNETFTRALTHQTMLMQDVMNTFDPSLGAKPIDFGDTPCPPDEVALSPPPYFIRENGVS